MLDLRLKMFKKGRLRRGCASSRSSISNLTSHIPPPSISSINNLTSHIPPPSTSSISNLTSHIPPPSTSSISNLTSHIQRSALTLIELLVVIVILTTLVGGVIPILSPNNDVRKIQAAGRGLQGYITVAQSQAARTGRPQGIAFRESSAGSGVALEVFGWEVPPPFAGFSTASAVRLELDNTVPNGNLFVQFILADTLGTTGNPIPDEYEPDPLPPRFFRPGDSIAIDGVEYRFLLNNTLSPLDAQDYFTSASKLQIERVNNNELTLAFIKGHPETGVPLNQMSKLLTAPKRYKINRQPTTSSADPYQLPASIVIDMQGSVAEGSANAGIPSRFPVAGSLFSSDPAQQPNTIGIMFSPTGAVDSVFFNGNQLTSVSRIVMMLGRIENGGIDPTTVNLTDNNTVPWRLHTNEKIEDVQERVNWLNLNTRLLSIIANNGRVVVSDPAFVDPSIVVDADEQLEAAHGFAHEMTTAK